jgi:hypothetical protein
MFIYVSGPYSAPSEPEATRRNKVEENIRLANDAAVEIAKKGHVPFVPHSMMDEWEDDGRLGRDRAMELCHQWVKKCDALYFIAPSPGAETERALAKQHKIPIYRSLDDIPDASPALTSGLSEEAREAYLVEYQECMDSYRHTYTTIWQAGAIFAAISAAVVAFSKASASAGGSADIAPWIQVLAPVPFLFWWWGIFVPMNRYGEQRNDRLNEIEELLNEPTTPGLRMCHVSRFSRGRKGESEWLRVIKLKWVWQPRVKEVVTIFGAAVLVLEIYLLRKHYWEGVKSWLVS